MPYRLLALDVDGTLLDSRGTIRPRVLKAVSDATAAGCRVVLATGRRLESAAPIAKQIGVSTLILTDGTVVFDVVAQRETYERVLDARIQSEAITLSVDHGLQPVLLVSPAAGGAILTGPASFDTPETGSYLGPKSQVRRLPYSELIQSTRIVHVLALGDEARVAQLAVDAAKLGRHNLVYWQPSTAGYAHPTLTFAPPDTSKGHALVWLAQEWGIPISETMAVGDYDNDVSLLQRAGLGIAMGNAVEAVRNVASAIVADNDHDGVAEAIERWILEAR